MSTIGLDRRPPVRLLTLTSLFPNSREPRHGIFVANRLRRLCDTGRVEATVLAPIPWFPGAYRNKREIPAVEMIFGFQVRHPRYMHIPGLGMRVQPNSLARAVLDNLRNECGAASGYDVVDAHYFYPDGVAAAQVAKELDLPLVISARGSDINLIGDVRFARQRMKQAAHQAQALVAVSGALAKSMVLMGMPSERIHVLRNGVDAEAFRPLRRRDARRRLHLDERSNWVLGVGNLVAEKGFELLIDAMELLRNARLLIVGEGPRRERLRARAAMKAAGRVEFRNAVSQSDLAVIYSACDVLALPSLREGWPNVLLEAMSCGLPVVASPVGGVPEILHPGAPGVLVSERTAEAWRSALDRVLANPPLTEIVRTYAVQFGWDEVVARQCGLYEEVASSKPSSAYRHAYDVASTSLRRIPL